MGWGGQLVDDIQVRVAAADCKLLMNGSPLLNMPATMQSLTNIRQQPAGAPSCRCCAALYLLAVLQSKLCGARVWNVLDATVFVSYTVNLKLKLQLEANGR